MSYGIKEGFSFNICITDGVNMVATRFRNDLKEPPSLYYSRGSAFNSEQGNFSCYRSQEDSEIIIASAPLHKKICVDSDCSSLATSNSPESKCHNPSTMKSVNGWKLIPKNSMILVEGDSENLSFVRDVRVVPLSTQSFPGVLSCGGESSCQVS